MLGESPGFAFAKQQFFAQFDFEDTAAAFDEGWLDAQLLFQRVRQTDGSGPIISHHAKLNTDLHHEAPKEFRVRMVERIGGRGHPVPTPIPLFLTTRRNVAVKP